MSKAVLLFNSIHFPFPVIDRAFSWAGQTSSSLVAIFLKAKKDPKEGYVFPSDLDAAEGLDNNENPENNHALIIDSNILMLKHQAANQHIEVRTEIMTDPSETDLLDQMGGSEIIFTDEKITEPGILTTSRLNLKSLLTELPAQVEWVSAQ